MRSFLAVGGGPRFPVVGQTTTKRGGQPNGGGVVQRHAGGGKECNQFVCTVNRANRVNRRVEEEGRGGLTVRSNHPREQARRGVRIRVYSEYVKRYSEYIKSIYILKSIFIMVHNHGQARLTGSKTAPSVFSW